MDHLEKIKGIGLDVASGLFEPGRVKGLDVSRIRDPWGYPEYSFDFVIDQEQDRERARSRRIQLSQTIRDRLVAIGDDDYPNVFIRNWACAPD